MEHDTLTISAAARLCRRDRRTLPRAIRAGFLHLDAQHRLRRDELILLGYLEADTPPPAPYPANLDTVSFTYMRSAADCILTTSQSMPAGPRSDKDRLSELAKVF
jgi:hypothetical protein